MADSERREEPSALLACAVTARSDGLSADELLTLCQLPADSSPDDADVTVTHETTREERQRQPKHRLPCSQPHRA